MHHHAGTERVVASALLGVRVVRVPCTKRGDGPQPQRDAEHTDREPDNEFAVTAHTQQQEGDADEPKNLARRGHAIEVNCCAASRKRAEPRALVLASAAIPIPSVKPVASNALMRRFNSTR